MVGEGLIMAEAASKMQHAANSMHDAAARFGSNVEPVDIASRRMLEAADQINQTVNRLIETLVNLSNENKAKQ